MMPWPLLQTTTAGGLIPQGIIDFLIGLCSVGVSALFGFTFAIQKRLTKMETNMEESQRDRDKLWAETYSIKGKCDSHVTKNTELSTMMTYIKQAIDELKDDVKDLKKEFSK